MLHVLHGLACRATAPLLLLYDIRLHPTTQFHDISEQIIWVSAAFEQLIVCHRTYGSFVDEISSLIDTGKDQHTLGETSGTGKDQTPRATARNNTTVQLVSCRAWSTKKGLLATTATCRSYKTQSDLRKANRLLLFVWQLCCWAISLKGPF